MKFLVLISLISFISADTLVTINSSKSINDISEKFISHEIDFYDLVRYRGNLAVVTPSYLKLNNFLEYTNNFDEYSDYDKSSVSYIFKSF